MFDEEAYNVKYCDICHRLYRLSTGHECNPITETEEIRWKLEAWLGPNTEIIAQGSL